MSLCATITPVLVISVLLKLTNSESTENSQFFVIDDPVKLTVKNILKDSATLQWDLPKEKRAKLKALRVSCIRIGSLVEPYIIEKNDNMLINPSVFESNVTIFNLMSASRYTCNLMSVLSLELGQEKLAILSEPVTFSTLLENTDMTFRILYGLSALKIIFGGLIPVLLVTVTITLVYIGHNQFRYMQNKCKDVRKEKYHVYMPKEKKNGGVSQHFPGIPKPSGKGKHEKRTIQINSSRDKSETNVPPVEVYSYRELAINQDDSPFIYDDMIGKKELAWDTRVHHKPEPMRGNPVQLCANNLINTPHYQVPT